MSFFTKITTDKDGLKQDAMRILRRLCEKGAVLAVAADMDKAVVVRDGANGKSTRTAFVESHIAQAMALKKLDCGPNNGSDCTLSNYGRRVHGTYPNA